MTNDDIEIGLGILAIFLMLDGKAKASPAPAKVTTSQTYVVVSGDTLSSIAGRFWGGSYNTWLGGSMLAVVNGISDPNSISPGQTLTIPPADSLTASQLSQAQTLATQAEASYNGGTSNDPTTYSMPSDPAETPADATMSNPDGTVS